MILSYPNMRRKLKQSLEHHILTRELYVFTNKYLCFGTCRQVAREMFVWTKRSEDPGRKNDISGYIWHRSFFQTVKYSFLDEKIGYRSFYGAPLTFNYFFPQGKVLCFRRRRQLVCAMFTVWSVPKTLLYLLTQTVHSNGKILFPWQKNWLSKFLGCAAHI